MSASGLTRSTSQQGTSGAARASPGHRFTSPGGNNHHQHYHQQQHHSTSATTTASLLQSSSNNSQQQQYVTIDEFNHLKRALERERAQREDAVTRLREELYEMKEARRREKLDATVAFVHSEVLANGGGIGGGGRGGIGGGGNGIAAAQSTGAAGGNGSARFPVPQLIGAAAGGDNSILSRLHRIELHQMHTLPQQLEALEDRLKTRADDKVKAVSEVSKAEFKRISDKIDAATKDIASFRSEVGSRAASSDSTLQQLSGQLSKTAAQLESLQAHRNNDDNNRQRIETELQAHYNFCKDLEAEVTKVQNAMTDLIKQHNDEVAANKSRSIIDDKFVANEVDRKLQRERDDLHGFVAAQLKPVEERIAHNNDSILRELEVLQQVAARVDTHSNRFISVEERCGVIEQNVGSKTEETLRQLEARLEANLANLNAANHSRLKELNVLMEAQIADKVSCSRDEIEDQFAQQIQEVNDRIDEVARNDAQALQQQQQYVRSLVAELEQGSAVASMILDGTESFIREMKPEHGAVYSSVLERIAAVRAASSGSDGEGPTVADAVKVLYQFERGQASSLSSLREDVGDLRGHIGLVGGALSMASPQRGN